MVRLPGICNWNKETTVLAHLNGGGSGMKRHDLLGSFSCSACHFWLDGDYVHYGATKDQRDLWHMQGMIRTQQYWLENGFIEIKRGEMKDREIEFLEEQIGEIEKVLLSTEHRYRTLQFRLYLAKLGKELFAERILKLCHTGE